MRHCQLLGSAAFAAAFGVQSAPTIARNRAIGAVLQRFTLPQDDAPTDLLGKLVSSTPPWFISLIVHFSIMILLGLLVLGANAVAQKG